MSGQKGAAMDRVVDNATPPAGRSYQGRALPRPLEELVDQGLHFDVQNLLSRRRLLGTAGLGAVGAALAACAGNTAGSSGGTSARAASSSSGSGLTEIPEETAGPFPGDGSNGPDVLEASGIVRKDIRSSFGGASGTAEGVGMTIVLTLLDISTGGSPYQGKAVYVWHCNRGGDYSIYSAGATDQNWLRGVQVSDADGQVSFTSTFPGCYSGRWPHIHFEVYPGVDSISDSTKAIATSQVALPKNVCDAVYATTGYEKSVTNLSRLTLTSDNVFGDDGGVHQLATVTGSAEAGFTVALTVPIDPTTAPGPSGGGGPPGGRGPAPAGQ